LNNDIIGLNQCIIDNIDNLNIDQNYGLAKQVLNSLNSNILRNLTYTYITMSLNDIKDRCVFLNDNNSNDNFNSSKNLLIEMISKNEINATIDEISGIVKFGTNKEENNPKILALLERNMNETIKLSDKLRTMQKTVLSSPQYISKITPKSQPAVMDWEDDHSKGV
jgi:COP9 signalosome complex subunit 3